MSEAPQAQVPHARHIQPRDPLAQFVSGRHQPEARVRAPVAALAVIATGIGAMTLASLTSDHHVAAGFDRAVTGPSQRTVASAALPTRIGPPVSGTEAYWLDTATRAIPLSPAAWTGRAIAPGDRFSFAGAAGRRILEVTEVRQLDSAQAADAAGLQASPRATSPAGTRATSMLLVTLRDTASTDAAPLRLLLDAQAPLANLTPLGDTADRDL